MNEDLAARLGRIESHMTHLEHQIDQMNQVILAQDKLLERLKKEMQRQVTAMETLELDQIKANNTKPPHYE